MHCVHRGIRWLCCASALLPALLARGLAEPPRFEREVLPLLAKHCHVCHGADKQEGASTCGL